MLIQAQVGPAASTTSLGAGTNPNLRLDNMGGLAATQLHPRYYETTYRRQAYTVATVHGSPVTTSVGNSTTYQGVFLGNPSTSTVNLVLTKVGYATNTAPAAAVIVGLMTGVGLGATLTNAGNTNIRNRFVGGIGSQAIANIGATNVTLPTTPVLETVFGVITTTTLASTTPNLIDLEGSIILPPGAFACIYTSTASGAAANFFGSMQWVEIPL